MSQRRPAEAEPILRDASRVLRAHHLVDAIFADMQIARLASARGDLQASEAEFREIRAEARRLGERHSQLEAAVYLAEIRLHRGDAGGAMELLAAAESEAGDDAELYVCALARVRGTALAALGRTEEACAQLESGLTRAREEGLLYEEALLLLAQESTALVCSVDPEEAAEQATAILDKLQVVTTSDSAAASA